MLPEDDMAEFDHDDNRRLPQLQDRVTEADRPQAGADETAVPQPESQRPSAEELSARALTLPRDDLMPRNKASDNDQTEAARLKMDPEKHAALREQMANQEGGDGLKLYVAMPGNPMAAPFHFSSSYRRMWIMAASEEQARLLATQQANDAAWSDPDQVHVAEFKAPGAAVISSELNA